MEERTIEVTLKEYAELIKCKFRIETVLMLIKVKGYVPDELVKAILSGDIEKCEAEQENTK